MTTNPVTMNTPTSVAEKRQLVKPNQFQQWGVQVVSLVPTSVHAILGDVVGGAVTDTWTAVALPQGKIHAFYRRTSTLGEDLQAAPLGHTLYHPGLKSDDPLLAISSDNNDCFVYAAHPTDGLVCLWRLSQHEKTLPLPRHPQARIKLQLEPGETLTCLSSNPLVVGTSWGRLFYCTQTVQPLMLHAQPMERPSTSLLSRFLSSSIVEEPPIVDALSLSKDCFLSVDVEGRLEHWKVTTTVAASHKANFEMAPVALLMDSLQQESSQLLVQENVRDIHVLRAACLEQDSTTHGLNFIVKLTVQQDEERLYWLQGSLENQLEFTLHHAVWLNRFYASEVSCVGLVTTHEQISYAAFQYSNDASLPVTVMALLQDSSVVHEVDLPQTQSPRLVVGTMGRDTVTHGWCALATSGLGLRGRWTGLEAELAVSATPRKRRSTPSDVVTLSSHLRFAFWHWYQNSETIAKLPPSLQNASAEDLEPAIIATATQLQHEGDASSARNPMEWHTSFVQLLQHGGLYRSLTNAGRYALLGIGQELAVYSALYNTHSNVQEPHGLAEWLQTAQSEEWLVMALETASQYRQNQSSVLYDISDQQPPTRLWTHHPTLQAVMVQQLESWQNSGATDVNHVTPAVSVVLESFAETSNEDGGEERYDGIKILGIPLVKVHDTAAAFDLSVQHQWYPGICQIALDNKGGDEQYRLAPLLTSGQMTGRDYKTGLGFGEFVLQWHADRGLYALVLNYGRHLPPDLLDKFLQKDDRVRQYQWIPAIRNQQFNAAADDLLQNADRPDATLSSCRWSLSMAKLSNHVAMAEQEQPQEEVVKRDKMIMNKMELVQAQEMLTSDKSTNDKKQPFLSPQQLFTMTMEQLDEGGEDKDHLVKFCLIGLAICRSDASIARLASQVWSSSLLVDMPTWKGLIQAQQSATSQELQQSILESTVFGRVLQQYSIQDNGDDVVGYNVDMENVVLEQMRLDAVTVFEMKRLLRIGTHLVLPSERPDAMQIVQQ